MIWTTAIECWDYMYSGLPNTIVVDQGTNLCLYFIPMAELHGVDLEHTGIESDHSIRLGAGYHQPLLKTFRKIIVENLSADRKLSLVVSTMAMNDILGPEGLVPSSLVFLEFPTKLTKSEITLSGPSVDERAHVAALARKQMSQKWPIMNI